jgi:hypothetical protein
LSLCRWGPFTLRSYLRAVDVKEYRHRYKGNTDEAQQRRGPWHSEVMVHGVCKEGEKGAGKRSDKGIDCNGAVGVEPVAVDEVAHALPKRDHAAKSKQGDGKHLWHPCDMRIACPCKPKQTGWKGDGSDDHGWQTLLRNDFAVLAVRAREVCGGAVGDDACAHDDSDDEGGERELRDAKGPAALFVEGDWELWVCVSLLKETEE